MEQQVDRKIEELEVEGSRGEENGIPDIFNNLNQQIRKDDESLYSKLVVLFLKKYSPQEKEKIEVLLEAWNSFDIEDLLWNEQFVGEEVIHFYKQIDILSARAYSKLIQYLKVKRTKREHTEQDKKWEPLREICWQNEIQFSLDRFFWNKRYVKKSGISFTKQGVQREEVEQVINNSQAKKIADWIQTSQLPLLKRLLQFMTGAHLFVLQGAVENIFMQKLQRISRKDQRQLFIKSISCDFYGDAKALHTRQFKSNDHEKQALQAAHNSLPNYYFYKGVGQPRIDSLQKKFQNYQFLESRHDYIQWMFPNHYGSAFNSKSFQLTYLQSSLFQQDAEIGLRMLFSIYLFFDFMGIRLHLPSLKLQVCSRKRLQAVILVNYHNHLRIMRVLACLSVTGFRPIALSLIDLLDKLTSPSKCLQFQREQFETSWQIYGDKIEGVPKKIAKDMCFLEEDTFPKDHRILSLLRAAMKQEKQAAAPHFKEQQAKDAVDKQETQKKAEYPLVQDFA